MMEIINTEIKTNVKEKITENAPKGAKYISED